jgi:hypothetical protein
MKRKFLLRGSAFKGATHPQQRIRARVNVYFMDLQPPEEKGNGLTEIEMGNTIR